MLKRMREWGDELQTHPLAASSEAGVVKLWGSRVQMMGAIVSACAAQCRLACASHLVPEASSLLLHPLECNSCRPAPSQLSKSQGLISGCNPALGTGGLYLVEHECDHQRARGGGVVLDPQVNPDEDRVEDLRQRPRSGPLPAMVWAMQEQSRTRALHCNLQRMRPGTGCPAQSQ